MKAMILAAGKGTRVNPISKSIPKPLIPLVNRPVLELLIEYLTQQGINEIAINTSHLSDKIEQACHHGSQYGAQILYSYEGSKRGDLFVPDALGSAGGMRRIQDRWNFFDQTFVVLCGDAFLDLDLNEVLRAHYSKNAVATVVLKEVPRDQCHKYGVVKCSSTGEVESFQEKPSVDEALSNTINTGIYIFEPEIFRYIPSGINADIGTDLLPLLVQKGVPFFGYRTDFNWLDIGTIEDIWQANRAMVSGALKNFRVPGSRIFYDMRLDSSVVIDPYNSLIRGPIYIGSGTIVEPGATIIGPTVIGANCEIKASATIRQCVIGDHYLIDHDCVLNEQVVLGGYCINRNGSSSAIGLDGGTKVYDSRQYQEPKVASAPESITAEIQQSRKRA